MPFVTVPTGANPFASRLELFARLMKSWVVRVFGPAEANETAPRVLCAFTGSSVIVAERHAAETFGSGLIPNWTTKPGTTRKNFTFVKKPLFARLYSRS